MLTYRQYGEKGAIKMWTELNDGKLVNLEKVTCIEIEENVIVYRFSVDGCVVESFKSSSDAQHRMENLKKLLK